MKTAAELRAMKCQHQVQALTDAELPAWLAAIPEWRRQGPHIVREFSFGNYYQTLAFVNALAWVVHRQDHHPELTVTYNRCTVRFNTHSVNGGRGGLSENDFICAAQIDALLDSTGA